MSRLGFDVATLVKLGRDHRAETVLAHLMREGISTRWALRDGRAPTGASVLISSHDRNAAIFTFRGANTLLDESDLQDDAFAVDVVYVYLYISRDLNLTAVLYFVFMCLCIAGVSEWRKTLSVAREASAPA